MTEDQTQTVSGAPSPRFVFRFWKSLCFVPVCFVSHGKEFATRPSALARVKSAWEFGGIAASVLAASPPARRSREISAAARGYPMPAAHPGPPFMGNHAAIRGSPSTPFAGDRAAGPPLTLAHRIATDSSTPDRRWLEPAGRLFPSSGQECRF